MKLLILPGLLLISLFQQSAFAKELELNADEEASGFGIGAIVGGLVAGPPGIIIGAAMGSAVGHEKSNDKDKIVSLENSLDEKNHQLSQIAQKIAALNSEHELALNKVKLQQGNEDLSTLTNNLSLSIYFKTNSSHIEPQFVQSINKIVNLIKHKPEIKIKLNSFSDVRGSKKYNKELSENRAISILNQLVQYGVDPNRIQYHAFGEAKSELNTDLDGYVYDRRVDVELTMHDEA